MSLSEYLNKNYLKGKEKKEKKEKKRRSQERKGGSDVVVKEAFSERSTEVEAAGAVEAAQDSQKGWQVVGTGEKISLQDESPREAPPKQDEFMSSGAKSGLQTAQDVAAQIRLKELEKLSSESGITDNKHETVFRNSKGEKINIEHHLENEKRSEMEQEAERKKRLRELNAGLVQLLDEKERKEGNLGSSSSKLNDQNAFEDPLISFKPVDPLEQERQNISRTGRKLYTKAFPENRFNIKPGWRWDGVDRSTGFEQRWFQKQQELNAKQAFYTEDDE